MLGVSGNLVCIQLFVSQTHFCKKRVDQLVVNFFISCKAIEDVSFSIVPSLFFSPVKSICMVKQRSDEPDDKALERLREFEQKRMPVTGEDKKEEKKEEKKEKKLPKNSNEKKPGQHDKATDEL